MCGATVIVKLLGFLVVWVLLVFIYGPNVHKLLISELLGYWWFK